MRASASGNYDGGMSGKHHTEESNEKNRQSHIGKIPWNKGKRDPGAKRNRPKPEKLKTPKIISDVTRQKLVESHKGKTSPRKGVHLTEATKKKLSESHKLPEGEKKRVRKICNGCGTVFYVTPSQDRYGNGKYHSKECQIKYMVKEKSPQWKGGIAPLRKVIQGQPEYINWRNKVFERDNYCDWFSGCKGELEAHHIIKFSKLLKQYHIKTLEDALNCKALWDINNGVTMLQSTHRAYHEMWG